MRNLTPLRDASIGRPKLISDFREQGKGIIAELKFATLALDMGLIPSKPMIESTPFDFLVTNRMLNTYSVQVKYTSVVNKSGGYKVSITWGNSANNTYNYINYFAVSNGSDWWIIPLKSTAGRKKIVVYPPDTSRQSQKEFSQYYNNWSQFYD